MPPLDPPPPPSPIFTRFSVLRLFLFPGVMHVMRGEHLGDIEVTKRETTKTLKAVRLNEYKNCFSQWQQCWQRFINAEGDYFKGNNVKLDVE